MTADLVLFNFIEFSFFVIRCVYVTKRSNKKPNDKRNCDKKLLLKRLCEEIAEKGKKNI